MKKFDELIQAARPAPKQTSQLNVQKFNAKLAMARRIRLLKYATAVILLVALLLTGVSMVQKGFLELVPLTLRYIKEVPALFGQYVSAYGSVIPWPSLAASAVIGAFYWRLVHVQSQKLNARLLRRLYIGGGILATMAIALALFGLQTGNQHAYAEQQKLRRALNQRGHIEVQVDGVTFEANAHTTASDQLIRNQAFMETLRHYDIAKVYPDLMDLSSGGILAEVRSFNPKDDCTFYVERRFEPAIGEVIDANSGCLPQYEKRYLNESMRPIKPPDLKPNQTFYMSWASYKDNPNKSIMIIVLLSQKADDYLPHSIDQKVVKEGDSPTGSHSCGFKSQNTCPDTPYVDVYSDRCGECGSAVVGNGTAPTTAPRSEFLELFGQIKSISADRLVIETPWKEEWTITWPYNVIEAFNQNGAKNYDIGGSPLHIEVVDSLVILASANLSATDRTLELQWVQSINLALEPIGANPLNGTYKNPKTDPIGKYKAE